MVSHDRVLERKLLASVLEPRILDLVADKLNGECFYILEHRIAFEAMLKAYQETGSTQTDLTWP